MKILTTKLLVQFLTFAFVSQAASVFAGTKIGIIQGREAGGGSMVTIDGSSEVLISDPFYKAIGEEQTFNDFDPQVRAYMSEAEKLLNNLGISNKEFWDVTVRGSSAVYIFVSKGDEKDVPCDKYLPALTRDVDEHFQFGCHGKGNISYLFEGFKRAKSVRQQVLGLIHERLWVNNPNVDQRFIAKFVTILGELLQLKDDQLYRNNRTALTDKQIRRFDELQRAAEQLGFNTRSYIEGNLLSYGQLLYPLSRNIYRQGGGAFIGAQCTSDDSCKYKTNLSIDNSSFIGIGSLLSEKTVIQNSVIVGSIIFPNSKIVQSTILDSQVSVMQIENSKIANSILRGVIQSNGQTIFKNVLITDSQIQNTSVLGTPDAITTIANSKLIGNLDNYSKIAENVQIENSNFNTWHDLNLSPNYGFNFHVQSGAILTHVLISTEVSTDAVITANTKVANLKFNNLRRRQGGIFDSKILIDSAQRELNFNGLNCNLDKRTVEIRTESDLTPLCK